MLSRRVMRSSFISAQSGPRGVGTRLSTLSSRFENEAVRPFSTNPKKEEKKSFLHSLIEEGVKQQKNLRLTITDYAAELRVRAAMSLTTSLSSNDREKVLKAVGAVDEVFAEREKARSIGEAVANAVAEEADKSRVVMEEQRVEILRQAEDAAVARLKTEIKIQEQRLKEEDEERRINDAAETLSTKDRAVSEKEKNACTVLGPVLHDLGYKRVHMVSAETLASIPVWEKQRTYRHDRARAMANYKMKMLHTGLPGVISLHETSQGNLSIIDGQHRVGMLTVLKQKQTSANDCFDLDKILVEVFPEKGAASEAASTSLAKDIFVEINKAEPVKLVDIPGEKNEEHIVIDTAAEALRDAYPEMFKPSQRCRSPHVNIDNLRDAIFREGIVERYSIKDSESLLDWMKRKNGEIKEKYIGQQVNGAAGKKKVSKNALSKATQYNFFLGIDSSWLYE